jgi:hypothetical protein
MGLEIGILRHDMREDIVHLAVRIGECSRDPAPNEEVSDGNPISTDVLLSFKFSVKIFAESR